MADALKELEAEQAVLGCMMIDSGSIREIVRIVRESDFTLEANRNIFRTICLMSTAGESIDGLTVASKLGADKELRNYLAEILTITPSAAHALEYAEIVASAGKRRSLYTALKDGAEALASGEDEAGIISAVEAAIGDGNERNSSDVLSPQDQMADFFRHRERIDGGATPYVRTGYKTLDQMLGGGLLEQGLYFLAARPGVGKTALALAIAEHVAATTGRVLFFSMEMSNAQLWARRLSMETSINSKVILMQHLTDEEYNKVAQASSKLAGNKLDIIDRGAMPVNRISAISCAYKDIKLVVVDHFTLISKPGKQQAFTEYAEIAHALKRLAKSINAPVLCLIQLNRESDQRRGRAHLSDLRGSGATEEDADGVMILHRIVDDDAKREPQKPIIEDIYLDKNRHGEVGRISLSFWPQVNKFRETYVT